MDNLDRLDQDMQEWFTRLPQDQRPQGLLTFVGRLAALVSPPMLEPGRMLILQDAASELGDPDSRREWESYDPGRSSAGAEYVTGPQSAGWYALVNGDPVKVEITFVHDEELKHDVLMELDLAYAMQHAPQEALEDEPE